MKLSNEDIAEIKFSGLGDTITDKMLVELPLLPDELTVTDLIDFLKGIDFEQMTSQAYEMGYQNGKAAGYDEGVQDGSELQEGI